MKNTKMPAIRFKGFNDDWEQRKLKDFVDKAVDNRGKTPPLDENGTHPLIEVAALGGGHPDYSKIEKYLNDDSFENNLRAYIKEGDILFTTVGSIGLVSLMDSREDAAIAQNIVAFRAKENFIPEYLYALFSNEDNQYKATRIVMGAVQPSIKVSQLVDVEYMLSTKEAEQKKIGTYFSNIDYLITLHQRKLEKIKLMKKSMLGKMFSRDAESIPKIRFDGYTDDWEQRKLGDVIEKLTGGASIAPDDYVDVGYRTIPKGAVNSSGVADMSGCKNVSENFFKKNISSKTSSGELVTSLRDLVPTAPNMGRIVRICGETEDFLMPQGVYSIIVKEKISEDFLITYSNSPEYRKIIMAEKNGSTQVHIRNGEFLNIDIPLPSYEEQMKIGEHFKTLNHLITLHQRKLEKLKKVKKSLLEHMFPMEK